MGNEEENRVLRLKRQLARPQRDEEKIKLWGIWNYYK